MLFVRSSGEEWLSPFRGKENVRIIPAPFPHYSIREQLALPKLIVSSGCSLFYAPHFNVPLSCRVPFLCSVHDLILHHCPNQAPLFRRCAYRFLLRRAVLRALYVVTVSEATRADLARTYGAGIAAKVRVAYPGIDASFVRRDEGEVHALCQRYNLRRPFLLYVGNCKQHKNVPMLIQAFREASLRDTELVLVANGKECAAIAPCPGVRIEDAIAHEHLPSLYSAASGFVTATLLEGFGFPLLEAMACECPVLGTLCGSLPEVCGEHALLVETSVPALAGGMRRILTDPELRSPARLSAAHAHARSFHWDRTAATIASLFASALPSP